MRPLSAVIEWAAVAAIAVATAAGGAYLIQQLCIFLP